MRKECFWTLFLNAFSIALLAGPASSWLAAQEPPAATSISDNIVVVLDASGSMKEPMHGSGRSKMSIAKESLLAVLGQVPPTTHVGVLVFSGHGVTNDLVYPLGPVDLDVLRQALAPIEPNAGTPLGAYLKKGSDMLLARRKEQRGYGTFRLLIVTDGKASDPQLVEAFLPEILARGLTIDVVGVDMKTDHSLATRVHGYRRADDSSALKKALSEVFAEVGSVGDGTVDEEAFAVVAAIPDSAAGDLIAALGALATSDQPIGSGAATSSRARESTSGPTSRPTNLPSPHVPGSNPVGAPAGGNSGDSDGFGRVVVIVLLVVGFAFAAQRKVRRKRRRQRYRGR